MRLDFNILWVEDEQANVAAQRIKLERLLKAEGFRLRVQFAKSVEEAKGFLADHVFADHIDLVLMDYNLEDGPNGDVGLKEVRRVLPYKDIIFYSARADSLRDYLRTADVSGVYLSSRSELVDTAEGVFHGLVKKVLDIDHSRGLVMGATSDIDHYVNDCLRQIFEGGNEEIQKKVIEKIVEKVGKIRISFEQDIANLEKIRHISELFDSHAVYTSEHRVHLLRKLLLLVGGSKEQDATILDYVQTVIPKRNDLAHLRVKINGFSRKLINRKGNEFTSDEMRQLRVLLLEKQETFEQIFERLKLHHEAGNTEVEPAR